MDVNPQKTTIGCLGPLPLHKVYAFDQCVPGLHWKRQSFDEIKPGMLANVGALKQSQLALRLEKSKLHGPPIGWDWDCLASPCSTSPEVQFPPKLIADLKQSFPSPSQIQAFTWPLAMQGKDHFNEGAIFQPRIFKSRFEVKCPFSGCPLSSHVLSSNAGCDWHCRYREWQNFGVSVASFQLLGRLFLPWSIWNPIQDNEVKIPTIPVDSIGFHIW